MDQNRPSCASSLRVGSAVERIVEPMAKILLVDDDDELVDVVKEWLEDQAHLIEVTSSGTDALEKLKFYTYDLILLDWGLPDRPGIEVLSEYRNRGGTTPTLMLTGKKEIDDKLTGLDTGADDYLTKPFHLEELSGRVRALLRRPPLASKPVLKVGECVLEPSSRRVTKNGVPINLLPREFALLEFLMRHPNQTFSPRTLLDRVWSSESDASPDTVRIHIMRLRNKLDENADDSFIKTVHRVGYMLVSQVDA